MTDKETFEYFRKSFPGTKRGLETEYNNFIKKHKDHKQSVHLLAEGLDKEISWRNAMQAKKEWIPLWKNMQTWINNRCWENEFPEIEITSLLHNNLSILQQANQLEQ